MYVNRLEKIVNGIDVSSYTCVCVLALVACGCGVIESGRPAGERQLGAWLVECELGMISDPACPVDGGWSAWAAWSPCRGRCDEPGRRTRARHCLNPAPSADGLPCSGPDEETQPCYLTNCTIEDFRALVAGDSTRAQAFRRLLTVPALAERCLLKECSYDAIEAALATDDTWQIDPEAFWNSLQCVKHNEGCPVAGEWGGWGAWGACGARCGRGVAWRVRRCDAPPPSDARLLCAGAPLETRECEGEQCAARVRGVREGGGPWGAWAAWSPCSEPCGPGVRRRRRVCLEKPAPLQPAVWSTQCAGPYEEVSVCENEECNLDGGWSGWSAWGPCSQSCGSGKKYRTRSCTRPSPAGTGSGCVGPKTEFGSCYLSPCDALAHVVAVFNGESHLQYRWRGRRSALFHFYVRFLPLSAHGSLVRRGAARAPRVRLSLQRWHLCVDARGAGGAGGCSAPRACSPARLEPAAWHSALLSVTHLAATLRLDDALAPIRAPFPCDPDFPNAKMNILVGERLHGEIQEMTLNFIPLSMVVQREQRSSEAVFSPVSSANVAFEKASIEEAYLPLENDQYLRLPCFDAQDEWRLELTIKPKLDSGTILFLKDDTDENWLHMALRNMRLKLTLSVGNYRSESSSTTECGPQQWLDVSLARRRGTNTVEATLNAGERVHVPLDDAARRRRGLNDTLQLAARYLQRKPVSFTICSDEFFVGGTPERVGANAKEEITPFTGTIATISINNIMQDLHVLSVERNKRSSVQLSSRTASVSGAYREAAWGRSGRLHLACVHGRGARSHHAAHWLHLDTALPAPPAPAAAALRALDDGTVLKLVASAENDLRGFYTCRAHSAKRTVNVVTYGVTGKIKYDLSQPDPTTTLAVITTVLLVLATLGWLIVEGVHDLRTGFGFFRDAHLTPEQEAEAVCRYIDEHRALVGSASAVRLAKARARYRAKRLALASRSSFAAQEPEGLLQVQEAAAPDWHALYGRDQSFTSSPRAGPPSSPPRTLASPSPTASSPDASSPRYLCNRLLAKKIHSSRQSLWSKRRRNTFNRNFHIPRKDKPNLLTIKSSTFVTDAAMSPAQKILQRFRQLRCDD